MNTDKRSQLEKCRQEAETIAHLYEGIPAVVQNLAASCNEKGSFEHVGPSPIPSQEMIMLFHFNQAGFGQPDLSSGSGGNESL
ncbi:MAG: hypothetical protein JRI85_16480 [Deltaproteobacteria bacterium]|nr:hypothetical protein [Deltaproteobacteria bacterium]